MIDESKGVVGALRSRRSDGLGMEPSGITARTRTTAAALALAEATTTLGAAAMSASPAAAAAAVTIDAPVTPRAGTVDLTGRVGVAPGEVTTVLYVYDATSSTASPTGLDCSGNGVLGPEDDLNQDQSVGDVHDC